jgi:hypothetical protein
MNEVRQKVETKSKGNQAGRQNSIEAMTEHQKQLKRVMTSCQQENKTPIRKR